ncbi:MAG: glycosyltransferase [Armatimonadetes bacterium]|nr:glycosyltransferase [Armatimonadota bacterium]
MRKPRLLWVSDSPVLYTGLARVARELLPRLACQHDVDITCYACFSAHKDIDPTKFPYRILPGDDQYGRETLEDVLRREEHDVLVTCGDVWMMDWVARESRSSGRWVAAVTLDGEGMPEKWQDALRTADKVVTCSSFGTQVVEKIVPERRLRTIPLGVDTAAFKSLGSRRDEARLGLGMADRFVVGCVARNQPRKQLPLLVRAFKQFLASRPNAVLYLHCDPRDQAGSDLVELIHREHLERHAGVTCNVSVVQGATADDLNAIYGLFDVFALPTMGEGFGLPILEAMACGVPVVATDCSAVTELVRGRGELIRVKDRQTVGPYNIALAIADTEHLVGLLHKLYESPELRAEYGRRGREFAETMTWDRCAEQWAELLEEVVAEGDSPSSTRRRAGSDVDLWPSPPVLSRRPPEGPNGGGSGMRIAVVSTFDYPCGIGVYSESLVEQWRKLGHEVWCLGERVPPGGLRGEFPAGQTVRCWQRGRSWAEVARTVRRLQPDVVNLQQELSFCWDPGEWDAVLRQIQAVCPVVVTYHTLPKEPQPVTRNRRPDVVVLTSPRAFEAALREGWTTDNLAFIPHATARPLSALPDEVRHRVVTWGILGQGKGYGECLEALKLLLAEFPDATLTIHAALVPGAWSEQVQFFESEVMPGVWRRGLDTKVRAVLGWPSDGDLQALVAEHSVGWLLYHHFDSAWCASASLQVGWSACRPVITSWAHHFDVTPDLQPLVYHTDKVEEVAAKTAALWRDPDAYLDLCQRLREHADSRGPAELAGEYLGVFETVLAHQRRECDPEARRTPEVSERFAPQSTALAKVGVEVVCAP